MKLYEHEGKVLLKKYGISVPSGRPVTKIDDLSSKDACVVVKPLVLQGKKGKAGAVHLCKTQEETKKAVASLLGSHVREEHVHSVLVEERIDIVSEHYLSITYDTDTRTPVIIFSKHGGVDIEEFTAEHKKSLIIHPVNPLFGLEKHEAQQMVENAGFSGDLRNRIAEVILKLYMCFELEDARLVEINPLALTRENHLVAVGAMIDLDDDAAYKHKERTYPHRHGSRHLTERELEVKKKNDEDHRGTIKYVELDGDIGFMAAGGGGSIICMDALITEGGKPSNYTEFSGNPSADKVYTLTKTILTKPGVKGLWIVGAIANFTRVDVTMEGIVKALEELKPQVPIVVRRSGPFEKEGLQLLRDVAQKHRLDIEVFGADTAMTATAKIIVQKAYIK